MNTIRDAITQPLIFMLVVCLAILFFKNFSMENRERIQEQNGQYAREEAAKTARRVADHLTNASDLIDSYAYFLSTTYTSGKINDIALAKLQGNSTFGAVRFLDADGVSHTPDGVQDAIGGREVPLITPDGDSETFCVMDSPFFKQPVIVFSEPVRHDGKLIGSLRGIYLADRYLRKMLESNYFGEDADLYLCLPDGSIISGSGPRKYTGSVVKAMLEDGSISHASAEKANVLLKTGETGTFINEHDINLDDVCVMGVPGYNLAIVQIFPRKVTQRMLANADMAGIRLEIHLILLLAAYGAFLLIRTLIKKRRLEKENLEFGDMLKATNILFMGCYCKCDMATKTFRYLFGYNSLISKSMPLNGAYATYIDLMSVSLATEDERKNFKDFFEINNLIDQLTPRDVVTYECHFVYDGHDRWNNLMAVCIDRVDGKPLHVVFMRQDITELKERELENSKTISNFNRREQQYQLAITSNTVCNYEINLSENHVEKDIDCELGDKKISLQTLDLPHPCAASAFFEAWSKMVRPEDMVKFNARFNIGHLINKFEEGNKAVELDYWIKAPWGESYCLRQSLYMSKDDLSGDIMALVMVRDITKEVEERDAQTQALRDALMQAQHANKAKTTFLSNMSHDIRTPMNAIIGFATIAAGHLDNQAQVEDCLSKVLSSSNHLLNLINDILDMSRIESGNLQLKEHECNISEITHNLVNIIQPQVKAKQLQLFMDTHSITNEQIITDPLKINQIFINLLGNAVKYTPSGGAITFSIEQRPAFKHGYADYAFTVADTGMGMSEEFVRHIFDPFSRESSSTISGIQGTGLGMAITKNIVEIMNGTIEVESRKGEGSKFTVTLPLKLGTESASPEDMPELTGMRALVVDDDLNICDSVDKMLKKVGLRSEWTASGKEAIFKAKVAYQDGDPYRTFIIDWQMPHMNGVETARGIRKVVGEDAPIIILTAYEWSDIEDEAKEAGVMAFCSKPLFMSDLRNALMTTLRGPKQKDEEDWKKVDFFGKRVLIVDDVEMNREVTEFILSESGFDVELASDGTDAVEMVKNSPENYYDVILMDVQMPTMNGYEATRAIRQMDRKDVIKMPIIAMTANAMEEDKAEALQNGMNAHIAKPLDIKNFFEVLKNLFY